METQNFNEEYAKAVQFLIDGEEKDAAIFLLSCAFLSWDSALYWFDIKLKTRRPNYDILLDKEHSITKAIHRAFEAILPLDEWEVNKLYITPVIELSNIPDIQADWRDDLLKNALGRDGHNQGTFISDEKVKNWNGFKFASLSEVQVAKELDKLGVLFLPNCKARFKVGYGRGECYPDFLICHQGKWGILEVDGPHHNTQSYIQRDRSRDQSLRSYGIFIERFDWKDCQQQPDCVVKRFLDLLDSNR
ncbi:MAG TPA: DUF559 domain-containing protein [Nostoc sp.]|uniref:DUF559 domain-containing protein n=1 Tax=Nostoc sp. TaxID=1180 RepID=UPI002D22E524|nr:DUF559 domain-containing protein [Nostoc sp.]HYX12978.1 DUF559 domain-containing protein [Nostoc sp.]